MSGQFQSFGNDYAFPQSYYAVGEHGQPVLQPMTFVHGLQPFPPQHPELLQNNFLDFDELNQPVLPAQAGARVRRRVGAGGEHVKFRRTRSGCYTCRNRRVKCDEGRPICKRCRKGSRECVYPEQSSPTKSQRESTKQNTADDDGSSPCDESDQGEGAACGEDEEQVSASGAEASHEISPKSDGVTGPREASEPPSLVHGKSPTSSTERSASTDTLSIPTTTRPPDTSKAPWNGSQRRCAELPKELKYFLSYARMNLSTNHYGFKYRESEFLQTTLIEYAVRYEPLLYAVVGFAAYHYTISMPKGRIDDFLGYYTKSVSLLRLSLEKNHEPSLPTLLTMLQLATIEEHLGDWVNCMAHQAAACRILTQLFTPQTVMKHATIRMIFHWYIRFDLFAGMMSGYGTVLSKDWFHACHDYYNQHTRERPAEISVKYEERWARLRLLAAETAVLCDRKRRGEIPDHEFKTQLQPIADEVSNWEVNLHPALKDPSKMVTDFSGAGTKDQDSIKDPIQPQSLCSGDIFMSNILALDFLGFVLYINYQIPEIFLGAPRSAGAKDIALRMCQIFEAVQRTQGTLPGVVLGMQAPLGVAATFLPQDDAYSAWARKKLATVEALGYVYPLRLRTRLASHWNVDVSQWWLPHEEGLPPIIRSIHAFINERTTLPRDQKAEDVRDMKGIFSSLNLSDHSSPESVHGGYREARPSPPQRSISDGTLSPGDEADVDFPAILGPPGAGDSEPDAPLFSDPIEFACGYE